MLMFTSYYFSQLITNNTVIEKIKLKVNKETKKKK